MGGGTLCCAAVLLLLSSRPAAVPFPFHSTLLTQPRCVIYKAFLLCSAPDQLCHSRALPAPHFPLYAVQASAACHSGMCLMWPPQRCTQATARKQAQRQAGRTARRLPRLPQTPMTATAALQRRRRPAPAGACRLPLQGRWRRPRRWQLPPPTRPRPCQALMPQARQAAVSCEGLTRRPGCKLEPGSKLR